MWQPYNATPEEGEAAGSDPANVYDVFERFNVLPSVKMLTFERIEPFQLVAYYKTPELLPAGTPACLGTWKVNAVPPVTEGVNLSRKIKVKVRLTLHGEFTRSSFLRPRGLQVPDCLVVCSRNLGSRLPTGLGRDGARDRAPASSG